MHTKYFTFLVLGAFCCLFKSTASLANETDRIDSLRFKLETAINDTVRIGALIELSKEYSNINMPMAMDHAKSALEMADNSGNSRMILLSLLNLGNACFAIGMFEHATRHYYRYLEISRASNNYKGIATALINIGAVKLHSRNFEEALSNFEEVLDMRLKNPDEDVIANENLPLIYNNIGISYENLDQYDKAVEFYNRSLTIATGLSNQEHVTSMVYNNLGKTYMLKEMPEEALTALQKALEIRITTDNKWGQAASYRNLGSFYQNQGDYNQALQNLYKGYELADMLMNNPLLGQMSENLFKIYELQGQADSAMKYHVLFKQYNDVIRMDETMKELTRLELTTQFNELEKQREVEIRRKELQYLFLGIFLLMLLIILGLFYYLSLGRVRRLKLERENVNLQSKNLQLQNENLEKELEMKNKELTTNIMHQITKNELLNDIAQRLLSHSHNFKKENQELIHSIIKDLTKTQNENVWDEFETRFHQVYEDFYQRLNIISTELSPNERRLCAFLRLNMTTKEIGSITGQSIRSIEVARTRLRKKLNLTNSETGLIGFLISL